MIITDEIQYVGVNDHKIDLFEGQYQVPNGMSYNSYLILDEKIAVMDSVDADFTKEWMDNIKKILGKKAPDYLIVQHMEPDHSANIVNFMEEYPNVVVVSSAKAFTMMKNFFETDYPERRIVVREGDHLSLGKHKLTFYTASMVHWPEVLVTYDTTEKVLFSADGFGKFGALDVEDDWVCEARRYYFGIIGKYGMPVQTLLKKVAGLEIHKICPLHGPVLEENLKYYLDLYQTWSAYLPEEEGVVIAYTSIYGNTKKAVRYLEEQLKKKGCSKVVIADLARTDVTEVVEDAFRYSKLVLATTTYNAEIFPFMREFLHQLTERNYSNRTVAFVENGSWAPVAIKIMKKMLEKSKQLCFAKTDVTIWSAMKEEDKRQLEQLANELLSGTDKK